MADSKITGLTADTTPTVDDLIVTVNDPAGVPANKKVTLGDIKTLMSASPTLVTPTIGVATATSVNKVAITAPATSATLTIANGKTLTANNSITLAGTDATVMTFPAASDTVAGLAAVQTITGAWSFNDGKLVLKGLTSGTSTLKAAAVAGATTLTLPNVTDTLAGLAAVQTITGAWSFNDAKLVLKGATSGTTTLKSGGTAGSSVITLPVATDTLVGRATTDTLTNKTITATSNSVSAITLTNPYKFSVYRNSALNTSNTAGGFVKITWDTELFDTNSNFSTGTYTAPVAGFYMFTWVVNAASGTYDIAAALYKNGSAFQWGGEHQVVGGGSVGAGATGSVMVQSAANDTWEVYVFSSDVVALKVGVTKNNFSGFLVSVT